jgi:rubrerythrin
LKQNCLSFVENKNISLFNWGVNRMSKDEFINRLREHIKLEDELADYYIDKSLKVKGAVLKLIFRQIAFDTIEHSDILETILALTLRESKPSEETVSINELEEHIKIERDAMKFYEENLEKTEDKEMKILFQKLVSDEKKHHEMLETIIKTLRPGQLDKTPMFV